VDGLLNFQGKVVLQGAGSVSSRQGGGGQGQTACHVFLLYMGKRLPPAHADGAVWYDSIGSLPMGM